MDSPLWIDKYAPEGEDFSQRELRFNLSKFQKMPINFLLYGPEGSGKSSAARIIAKGPDEEGQDLVEFNISDLFNSSKKEIVENPLFSGFISSGKTPSGSKESLVIHLIKESASYPSISGGKKIMMLDNFESAQRSFQQALRRIIEQYHRNTQFILTTRQLWKVIPAIRSRCYPISVRSPADTDMKKILVRILDAEEIEFTDEAVDYIVANSSGNLRSAIVHAQAVSEGMGEVTYEGVVEIIQDMGINDPIIEMIDCSLDGKIIDARSFLEKLIITSGYTGGEILEIVGEVVRNRDDIDQTKFALVIGEVDFDLANESNSVIHLTKFLTKFGSL